MIFPHPLNEPSNRIVGHFGEEGDVRETELAGFVSQIIRWLSSFDLSPKELVAVSASSPKELWATHLALMHLGIPIMPIAHDMPAKRADALLASAAPQIFLKSEDIRFGSAHPRVEVLPKPKSGGANKLMSKLLAKKKTFTSGHPAMALSTDWPATLVTNSDNDSIAYVLFTSGSTAAPKGVQLTFGNLRSHFKTLQKVYGLTREDRILNNLSLGHADGLLQGPMLAHFCGCVYLRPFDSVGIHNIAEFGDQPYLTRATHVFGPPVLFDMMSGLEHARDTFDYPEARLLISCSAMLDRQRWETFENTFKRPVVNVFGLTETVAGSLFAGPEDETRVLGTVGVPVDCEIRIVNEQGDNVQTGQKGELWIRGAHTSPGYWKRPDLTDELYPETGWLASGDYAVEKNGLISIEGRKKSAINVAGFLVHPEEVTEALRELDGIRDAHSLGFLDSRHEERVGAAVVLEPGHAWSSMNEAQLLAAIAAATADKLESYKRPAAVQIWPALPIGASGKVVQNDALAKWKAQKTENTSTDEGEPLEAQLLSIARNAFKNKSVSMQSDSTNTNGWDSMAHLDFIVAIERAYSIRFTTSEMMKANTLQIAFDITQQHLKNR